MHYLFIGGECHGLAYIVDQDRERIDVEIQQCRETMTPGPQINESYRRIKLVAKEGFVFLFGLDSLTDNEIEKRYWDFINYLK